MAPSWAVVVPTYRRARLLPRLVTALEQQVDPPPFELVVVDDASDDDTPSVVTELARSASFPIVARRQPRNAGPAAARNLGWRTTSAEMVAFLDDDCVPSPGWLASLATAAEQLDIVQGVTQPDPQQAHLLGPFARTIAVSGFSGLFETCNIAYRRSLIQRLDGFDVRLFIAGEDTDLGLRAVAAGALAGACLDATVLHDVRPSSFLVHITDLWRWHTVPITVGKHPQLRRRLYHGLFWKRTHASALVAAAGLGVLATRRSGRLRLLGAICLAPYGYDRMARDPLPHTSTRDRARLLPAALACDLVEIGVCAAGSIVARTVVL